MDTLSSVRIDILSISFFLSPSTSYSPSSRRTRQWSPPEHPPRGARLTSTSSTPLNTSAFLFANKRIQIQTVLAVKRWRQRSE